MRKITLTTIVSLTSISLYAGEVQPTPAPPTSAATRGDIFLGGNVRDDAWYTYAGFNYALNGDTSTNGFLLHGMAGYGEYEYDTDSGGVDGEVTEFDLGIGYQWFVEGHRVSAIAAVNFADHDLTGSAFDLENNSVNGDEVGFKPKIEIWNTDASTVLYGGTFTYSTAYDSYWTRAMCGLRVANVYLGPEIVYHGNEEYEEIRTGLALAGLQVGCANIGASLGYAWASPDDGNDDQEGIYGTVHASFSF